MTEVKNTLVGIMAANDEIQTRGLWRQGCTPEQICVYIGESYDNVVQAIEHYFQITINKTYGGKPFYPKRPRRRSLRD